LECGAFPPLLFFVFFTRAAGNHARINEKTKAAEKAPQSKTGIYARTRGFR
jgi:hypothetical protein